MNILRFATILAILLLGSCSTDTSDDIEDSTGVINATEKILRVELKPVLPYSDNVVKIEVLLAVNSPNQSTDVVGEIYDGVEHYDVTQSLFDYEFTDNTKTLSFTTTKKVYRSGITILLVTDGSVNIDRILYEMKVYADDDLVLVKDLILDNGSISKLYNPVIDWDFL